MAEAGAFESSRKPEAVIQTLATPEAPRTKNHKFPDCLNG